MLNIVIPMAGEGSRFAQQGFIDPKPFIKVDGIPMIELVIANLRPSCPHRFIFICREAHLDSYRFMSRLNALAPGCSIISVPGLTAGAACSVLMATDIIDNVHPLLIANADQWIDADIDDFLSEAARDQVDGLIMTMPSDSPKWSYVRRDEAGRVCQVVEKKVVSQEATVGVYYFRHGADFCFGARGMISDDERSQGEFYVAPVYSRLYSTRSCLIQTYDIGKGMHGLGTPADFAAFLSHPAMARAVERTRGVAV